MAVLHFSQFYIWNVDYIAQPLQSQTAVTQILVKNELELKLNFWMSILSCDKLYKFNLALSKGKRKNFQWLQNPTKIQGEPQ